MLLNTFNEVRTSEILAAFRADFSAVETATGHRFQHRFVLGAALLHPSAFSVGSPAISPSFLTYQHLSLMGEALLRYSAMELTWAALQPPQQQPRARAADPAQALPFLSLFARGQAPGAPSSEASVGVIAELPAPRAELLNAAASVVGGSSAAFAQHWKVRARAAPLHKVLSCAAVCHMAWHSDTHTIAPLQVPASIVTQSFPQGNPGKQGPVRLCGVPSAAR